MFSGGTGTASDPYLISTVQDLRDIDNNLSACYKMINDIDFAGTEYQANPYFDSEHTINGGWMPIGSNNSSHSSFSYISDGMFTGTFDGCGHVIRNLGLSACDRQKRYGIKSTEVNTGFFNCIGAGATVKSVIFDNTNVEIIQDGGILATGIVHNNESPILIEDIAIVADIAIQAGVATYEDNAKMFIGILTGRCHVEQDKCKDSNIIIRNISILAYNTRTYDYSQYNSTTLSDFGVHPYLSSIVGYTKALYSDNILIEDINIIDFSPNTMSAANESTENCYEHIGGIFGYIYGRDGANSLKVTISNCCINMYHHSETTDFAVVGGIAGEIRDNVNITIQDIFMNGFSTNAISSRASVIVGKTSYTDKNYQPVVNVSGFNIITKRIGSVAGCNEKFYTNSLTTPYNASITLFGGDDEACFSGYNSCMYEPMSIDETTGYAPYDIITYMSDLELFIYTSKYRSGFSILETVDYYEVAVMTPSINNFLRNYEWTYQKSLSPLYLVYFYNSANLLYSDISIDTIIFSSSDTFTIPYGIEFIGSEEDAEPYARKIETQLGTYSGDKLYTGDMTAGTLATPTASGRFYRTGDTVLNTEHSDLAFVGIQPASTKTTNFHYKKDSSTIVDVYKIYRKTSNNTLVEVDAVKYKNNNDNIF